MNGERVTLEYVIENGEVFKVNARVRASNVSMTLNVEGILVTTNEGAGRSFQGFGTGSGPIVSDDKDSGKTVIAFTDRTEYIRGQWLSFLFN